MRKHHFKGNVHRGCSNNQEVKYSYHCLLPNYYIMCMPINNNDDKF